MKVIACVGEKIDEREAGQTQQVIELQMKTIAGDTPYVHSCVFYYRIQTYFCVSNSIRDTY